MTEQEKHHWNSSDYRGESLSPVWERQIRQSFYTCIGKITSLGLPICAKEYSKKPWPQDFSLN